MSDTIRQTIIEAIRDSWSGGEVPSPYAPRGTAHNLPGEYSRGQFELAVQLLGYNGNAEMSDAVMELWREVRGESAPLLCGVCYEEIQPDDMWATDEMCSSCIHNARRSGWEG